jgi:DNA-directed RNA polymerase beta' subunit
LKLELLDIDKYILNNQCQPITSTNIFSVNGISFDPNGLWSEEIFGRIGSKERRSKFGYINLNSYIINPILYNMVSTISTDIKNIMLSKELYILNSNKLIIDSTGETGLLFFYKILNKIKFIDLIKGKPEKTALAKFLDINKNLILTKSILVLPAGDRDLRITKSRAKQITSEVNNLYERVISLSSQILIQSDDEMKNIFLTYIQKGCLQILTWLQDNIKGKQGLFRSTMLKKTIDFSARIAVTSDPELPLGFIGIPWHSVLLLYQPFFFNYVLRQNLLLKQSICEYLNIQDISIKELTEFIQKLIKYPDRITGDLKNALVICAEKITEEKFILCKRDPVVSRSSYYSAKIKVLLDGRVVVVNSLTTTPQKLDFDGDTVALIPVFTKSANEEAKKLCVNNAKSAWMNPTNFKGHNYILTLDSISTIYSATVI